MIAADETEISGQWTLENGHVVEDENCRRIAELIGGRLVLCGRDDCGWSVLYRDPADGKI